MTEDAKPVAAEGPAIISDEQLRKAEAYVEAEEGATNRLGGWAGTIVTAIARAASSCRGVGPLPNPPPQAGEGIRTSAMSDNSRIRPIKPDRPGDPPPVPVSPRLLTWWFGLMALGGVGFGLYAEERPFGNGVLAYPLVVFFAFVAAGLLTLRFLHARPVPELISERCLAIGVAIGIVCFFIGNWFGVSLLKMP